jgi:hypothetical protein
LVALSGAARAEDSFVLKTQIYTDSDNTVVVSPLVGVSKDTWRGGTVSAGYVSDIVTSASIDVVSNATKRMSDVRNEVSLGVQQKVRDTTLNAGYIYSQENDYRSHVVTLGVAQDLFQRNTTLSAGYAVSLNDIYRTGDSAFHRSLTVHTINAAWTQTLNRATIMQISYSFAGNFGYQASPYRFVRIENGDLTMTDFKVPETDPDQRFRHAFVAGLNRHLGKDSSLQFDYRIYFDSWDIVSHTVQIRYFVKFGNLTLRLRERFYYQGPAYFYREHYTVDTLQPFVTSDRELSTLLSNMLGVKISYALPVLDRALELEAKADVFYFKYFDYALLDYRVAANLGVGLNLRF